MSEAFKKAYEQKTVHRKEEVHRAVVKDDGAASSQGVDNLGENVYSKIKSSNSTNDSSYVFQPQTQVGGAYYLPITKPAEAVIEAVISSWQNLAQTDFSANKAEYVAHGVLYNNEKYMLARTKLCKLDNEDPEEKIYLEINKLEGDGFVFADSFKKSFVEPLVKGAYVEDTAEVAPLQAEEEIDGDLRFLDFSADADSAQNLMQQLLQNLKPGGGVAYDAKKIFESVSTLGHNATESKNLEYFAAFQEHIVTSVLEILRHDDLNFLPTVYFGSKLINTFLASEFDKDLVTWATFNNIVDGMKKHCISPASPTYASQQVMRSRQSYDIMMDSLNKLSKMLAGIPLEDDLKKKIMKGLDEQTAAAIEKLLH